MTRRTYPPHWIDAVGEMCYHLTCASRNPYRELPMHLKEMYEKDAVRMLDMLDRLGAIQVAI